MFSIKQIFGPSASPSHAGVVVLASYLFGGFSAGYWLVRKLLGLDVRDTGSGSTGSTNVGRLLGRPGFTLTAMADFAKGTVAVWAARWWGDDRLTALAMIAVVVGHVWPAQLGLRGGKGVATSLGALLCYDPHVALLFGGAFAGLLCLLRRKTSSGLVAFGAIPLSAIYLHRPASEVVALSVLAVVVLAAHRTNLIGEFQELAGRRAAQPLPEPPVE